MDVMLVLITDMVQFLFVGEPLGTDSGPGVDAITAVAVQTNRTSAIRSAVFRQPAKKFAQPSDFAMQSACISRFESAPTAL
jgi:hypothetical protein